ncbi:low molecular weight protein-tyrosine-phosphatase [Vibrio zhugei]|uniref:protein-tyrosine-phosphatase n=1 Tax=Vibrio zhugei TaxID=2479546 RepID=A0ABV7C5R6_9VIBR|nr:low molecular weight protein-tyrosine-phosphatase [Vibrio zhugei]
MTSQKPIKVLMVCMGNICRSPTAQVVFERKAQELGIRIEIDSAGVMAFHEGETPDPRTQAAGKQRGYSFSGLYSRPIVEQDFVVFDYIFAADEQNLADLKAMCPAQYQSKVSLLLAGLGLETEEIPDPYYGGGQGFSYVLDLLEQAAALRLPTLNPA